LANWETICYPLDEPRLLHMEGNPKSTGIWAPCLSHCDGTFYLVYTDMKYWHVPFQDSPNYITTAKDIRGPWSDPVFINCSGFDPSLFHDDDGRKYFVSMEWDYRKFDPQKEATQFTGILVTELDPKTLKPIAEPRKVFKGSPRGLVEGPHVYKKDGWYYLLTAEGGTTYEHAETVARSREPYGPYELHPETYLVCSVGAPEKPIQKTGHGQIAQGPDGRYWFAYLCGRPIGRHRRCPLGRETAINEIIWKDNWPYLKNGTTVPDESFAGYGEQRPPQAKRYGFGDESFLLDFQGLRSRPKYALEGGALRLWGGNSPCCNFGQGALLRRQADFGFEAKTSFKLSGQNFQQMAGLIYRYDEETFYYLRVAHDDEAGKADISLLCMDHGGFGMPVTVEIPDAFAQIHLKLAVKGETGAFSYSLDGKTYTALDYTVDATKISDDYARPLGFTGAFVGMQCVDMRDKTAFADFYTFEYIPQL
jgi:xylan 1,4-beta-xylosidase